MKTEHKDGDLEYVMANWDHYKANGIPHATQSMLEGMLGMRSSISLRGEMALTILSGRAAFLIFQEVLETRDPQAVREHAARYIESTSFRNEQNAKVTAWLQKGFEALSKKHQ
jgi:hypothetical protein